MRILIFGGTSEAHALSDNLIKKRIAHTLSVATSYGEKILKEDDPLRQVIKGRMDEKEMAEFMTEGGYDLVIDATHSYALQVTENISSAVKSVNESKKGREVKAVRLVREAGSALKKGYESYEKTYIYKDVYEAAEALKNTSGNILLTTGSKELSVFAGALGRGVLSRLYARVIPGAFSIKACEDAGIETSHIIAMQGPFCKELNQAVIQQYGIRHLVTKDSGAAGGFKAKLDAAKDCGIEVHLIARPEEKTDMETAGYEEVLDMILSNYGKEGNAKAALKISLAGIGMGDVRGMTREVYDLINSADLILGAKRMIDICRKDMGDHRAGNEPLFEPLYKPQDIVKRIDELIKTSGRDRSVVILFSGDSGFNSGCAKVYEVLKERIDEGLNAEIKICPGISSVAYLASRIGRPYDNAYICSMHGRGKDAIYKTAAHVRINHDVYALTGGCEDIISLSKILCDAGMGDCIITAAADLSSPDEKLITDRAESFAADDVFTDEDRKRTLYTCHISNPSPVRETVSAGLSAEEFIRGSVPMTKEEVRAVTMDKLRLTKESRVLDIGCGTGSVSVEIGRLIPDGLVYSYDNNDEAVSLTLANVRRHKLPNVIVKKGEAPEIISAKGDFPEGITHAFIGGSKGRLKDILDFLKENFSEDPGDEKRLRVVVNAVTDKTVDTLKSWIAENEVFEYDAVKIGVCRGDEMIPGNDVYIFSFEV